MAKFSNTKVGCPKNRPESVADSTQIKTIESVKSIAIRLQWSMLEVERWMITIGHRYSIRLFGIPTLKPTVC